MGNRFWVKNTERFLIEALLKCVENSDRTENRFKKSAWETVAAELNKAYKDIIEKPITIALVKSKKVIVSLYLIRYI